MKSQKKYMTENIKNFKDLGLSYERVDAEGKRIVDAKQTSFTNVLNKEIIVVDLVEGVKSKYGHGEKSVVIVFTEEGSDERFKTMSSSKPIVFYAQKIIENNLLPFKTTIIKKDLGGVQSTFTFA